MANNKFQLSDGTVLLDLTGDTAVESDVAQGKTFHKADGSIAVGTATGGGTEQDMYAGAHSPLSSVDGDLWVDTSDEGALINAIETTASASSTSITFDGLHGEPKSFSIIDRTAKGNNFSGRAIMCVVFDGDGYFGNVFYNSSYSASTLVSTEYSHSYSNGSLSVVSNSSNSAGQFYSGSVYELVYVY